ncbi:mitochondrial import inner membrane translocase subunit tim21 [Candidozyma auris]|uniref:Mitochondrial import inner membrane translocase subunit Tim21 n=2 Tax=Candidozyma auris TaxID=498019 RepID=A0AB36WDE5_CANAR|nr:hypothetical protein CJI97_000976 [[Candida] auris]PIS58458.1 hypothetical protein B9J08_000957 [[Candida] auris]PSK74966.1 hypothetical protein CJJ07_005274 [[Candida] auris]QEL60798.1 hypothetical protein CJJ09_002917 [[Candida] auris]QWW23696.1 hypothetical protein CA7LBN_002497 [[Candida] auris]
MLGIRPLAQASRMGLVSRHIQLSRYTPKLFPSSTLPPRYLVSPLWAAIPRAYSTKTAPPPPPPPKSDKNARGKALLSKITRFFTFSAATGMVIGAVAVSGLVIYLILSELFLPSGDTRTFNKALKEVENSAAAQQALGFSPGDRLKAYGEAAGDRWTRNRPAQSTKRRGPDGKDRMVMRFHVVSPRGRHASVILEQIDTSWWSSEFSYIALELPNRKLVYVIEPKFSPKNFAPRGAGFGKGTGFLGLNWGPKKD